MLGFRPRICRPGFARPAVATNTSGVWPFGSPTSALFLSITSPRCWEFPNRRSGYGSANTTGTARKASNGTVGRAARAALGVSVPGGGDSFLGESPGACSAGPDFDSPPDSSPIVPKGGQGGFVGLSLSLASSSPLAQARPAPPSRPGQPASPAGVQKKLPEILEKVIAQQPAELPVQLSFQDETRFGRLSGPRRCWAPWPSRPTVGQQVIREYNLRSGRYQPLGRQTFHARAALGGYRNHVAVLSPNSGGFPRRVLHHAAGRSRLASSHRPTHPSPLRLVSLPPDSPELNSVEHLWEHLRENYFGNRVWPSLAAVTDRLGQGLRNLDQQPEQVKATWPHF